MKLSFVTLFPELCLEAMRTGVLGRGVDKGLLDIETIQIRDFTDDKYGTVDDTPYGGGPGMVLKAEPVIKAVQSIQPQGQSKTILLTPNGQSFKQSKARQYASFDHLIFICGRYEGIDERVKTILQPDEISIGDYVLSGGEIPALAIADATCRLIEGVLGAPESLLEESFSENQKGLEYPHYTKPRSYQGHNVPDVLLGGNHRDIENWRREQSQQITEKRRPDLLSLQSASLASY